MEIKESCCSGQLFPAYLHVCKHTYGIPIVDEEACKDEKHSQSKLQHRRLTVYLCIV